ncbi:MAG: GntR family transcriptional regulator [Pseudomonadota bacterium]
MGERGSLPKHIQISEMLAREIAAGRLSDGARLPSERDMAAELGVAVGTLRRALDNLTEQGLMERVQGSGNYVRQGADPRSVYAFFGLERPGGGGLPTAIVLDASAVARPADLGTEGGCADVLRIRRLRLLDGLPAALEEIWLDAPGAAGLDADALSDSLYLSFQRELGVSIERTEDRVATGTVPGWGAREIGLAAGQICGHVRRRGWSGEQVIEQSETWFDGARAEFVSRRR